MRSNRALVLEAARLAGLDVQDIPVDSSNRFRVAVRDDDRRALLEQLAQHDITVHLYLDSRSIASRRRVVRLDTGDLDEITRLSADAHVIRVFEYQALKDGSDAFGHLHGCEVEFWSTTETGELRSARWNEFATALPADRFGSLEVPDDLISRIDFPIDLVYTWVDGDDPSWRRRRAEATGNADAHHAEAGNDARFASRDELRYSLRSVERFADFVRNVYIVTDMQTPDWLDTTADGIRVVDHSEIFADPDSLPTFNSHAIEAQLHRIPGLAEHYLYLNDDFFFGRRVRPELFFYSNGVAKQFLSRSLIPIGDADLGQKPVDAAAMTGRSLVQDLLRSTPTRKFKHAPYPQLKSVNAEIESLFHDEWLRTTRSRLRHPSDIAVASSLHHHVAYATARSVPAAIEARYVDLGRRNLEARLDGLLDARNFDTCCLNDSDSDEVDEATKAQVVRAFFDTYLPVKSRYEK